MKVCLFSLLFFWGGRFLSAAKSNTFVDSCNFQEENICGMIQGPGYRKWEQRSSVSEGPQTDFTNMGQCKGDCRLLEIHLCEDLKINHYKMYVFIDHE